MPMSIKLFLKHSRNFSVLCTKAKMTNHGCKKKNVLHIPWTCSDFDFGGFVHAYSFWGREGLTQSWSMQATLQVLLLDTSAALPLRADARKMA